MDSKPDARWHCTCKYYPVTPPTLYLEKFSGMQRRGVGDVFKLNPGSSLQQNNPLITGLIVPCAFRRGLTTGDYAFDVNVVSFDQRLKCLIAPSGYAVTSQRKNVVHYPRYYKPRAKSDLVEMFFGFCSRIARFNGFMFTFDHSDEFCPK